MLLLYDTGLGIWLIDTDRLGAKHKAFLPLISCFRRSLRKLRKEWSSSPLCSRASHASSRKATRVTKGYIDSWVEVKQRPPKWFTKRHGFHQNLTTFIAMFVRFLFLFAMLWGDCNRWFSFDACPFVLELRGLPDFLSLCTQRGSSVPNHQLNLRCLGLSNYIFWVAGWSWLNGIDVMLGVASDSFLAESGHAH